MESNRDRLGRRGRRGGGGAVLALVLAGLALSGCRTPMSVAPSPTCEIRSDQESPRCTYYGTNPRVDAQFDATSTFAVDVDDGSFALAKAQLDEGRLPERDGVRVEEFVNHFDYGYPRPTGAPLALIADGAPSPFEPGAHVLRFALQASEPPLRPQGSRRLTFLIDTSGSSGCDSRLSLIKYCVLYLVERMPAGDQVAVVAFADSARTVLRPTPAHCRQPIWDAVQGLRARGNSNLAAGLGEAYRVADGASASAPGNQRIILCSDGLANACVSDPQGLAQMVRRHKTRGTALSAVGFGVSNYDDTVLEQVANAGDGTYAHVDDQEDIHRHFGPRFLREAPLAARDVRVQVEFDPSVVSTWRLLGYENRHIDDPSFRASWEDGGEIGAGQSVTALYVVRLHREGRGRVASFRVNYENPHTRSRAEARHAIGTDCLAPCFEQTEPGLRLAVAAAELAEILRESPWVRGHRVGDVRRVVEGLPASRLLGDEISELRAVIQRVMYLGGCRL